MKKIISLVLCLLIAILTGSVCVFAQDETAADTAAYYTADAAEDSYNEDASVNPCCDAKINVAPARNFDYGTVITIKATASGVPEKYFLTLFIDGKAAAAQEGGSETTEVSFNAGKLTKNINYTVKVVDENGNVQTGAKGKTLSVDGGTVKCVKSFFKIIAALFRGIFGSLPEATVEPLNQ